MHSFKAPSAEELDRDFMWRCTRLAPRPGMIGIFNRSYYEEVLVVRVNREYLAKQQLPPELVTDDLWDERFKDIRSYERYMARNGAIVRQFRPSRSRIHALCRSRTRLRSKRCVHHGSQSLRMTLASCVQCSNASRVDSA